MLSLSHLTKLVGAAVAEAVAAVAVSEPHRDVNVAFSSAIAACCAATLLELLLISVINLAISVLWLLELEESLFSVLITAAELHWSICVKYVAT